MEVPEKGEYLDNQISKLNALRDEEDKSTICHAPFKSIRFEPKGLVYSCCYNHDVVLGRYPEQSIRDIWFGEIAEKLRSHVTDYDLSYGCQLCANQLSNGELETIKTRQYDNKPTNENRFPIMLDFSIHNTCNLECIMCNGELSSSIRKNREHLPPLEMAYDDEFVNQLKEFIPHAKKMVFAGGEPFLTDLNFSIWDAAVGHDINMDVVTNGTIFNTRVKDALESLRFNITLSIESLDKKNYESIRINSTLERVLSNMDYFKDYCQRVGKSFAISVCPLQQNWQELPEFVAFCNKRNTRLYLLVVTSPYDCTLKTLPPDKLQEVIDFLGGFTFNPENQIQQTNINEYNDLIIRLKSWHKNALEREAAIASGKFVTFNVFKESLQKKLKDYLDSGKLQDTQAHLITRKLNQAMDLFDHSCDLKHLPRLRYDHIIKEPVEIMVNNLETMEASLIANHLREVFINN